MKNYSNKTRVVFSPRTRVWGKNGRKVQIQIGAKIELLPYNTSFPDGSVGNYLPQACYLLLLKTIGIRCPYIVTNTLKASNGQFLVSFVGKNGEVTLNSLKFKLSKLGKF